MVERAPIEQARVLIQQCVSVLEQEQQTFTTLRLRTDLAKAMDALAAVQTVALAPIAARRSECDE